MLRGVLSATAHDLGGLASALSLRVDVLERHEASEASAALRRIATELRTLGHDVRAFRESEGGDALSPSRTGSLVQWLARLMRYGRPVLPRGSTLDGVAPDALVAAADAQALSFIALAVLWHIADVGRDQRLSVRVDVHEAQEQAMIVISATAAGVLLPVPPEATAVWWQWALSRAQEHGIPMSATDGLVTLVVPLLQPGGEPAALHR